MSSAPFYMRYGQGARMRRAKGEIFSKGEWAKLIQQLLLSPREVQIIRLLCTGHKNYSAASVLGISPETVRTHLKRLYAKLGVRDRFELLCLLVCTARDSHPLKR